MEGTVTGKKLVGTLYSGGSMVGGVGTVFGKDGITPHIGENGNWWVGDQDTGVHAQGDSGVYIGTTEPTDPSISVWINPSASGIPIYNGEVL